ncbi:SRPBCC family protein [Phaeacidiphilus oryzae]|uniref:SRPBCC family protein n=1 Tax=Phaeacidiphilus oryzae TaxID=348818 RepID=UPI00056751EE|nr:SRPBCC family protein [Phaeacidiphilus oryzae]
MEWTGARYADCPTVQAAVVVDAPPGRVWRLVSDPTAMPRWSAELRAVRWLDGAREAAPGARFEGSSAHPALGEWSTVSRVESCEPEHCFAWAVQRDGEEPGARWRFTLRPTGDGGTELVQWAQLGPGRSGLSLAIERMPEKEQKIVFVRLREFEESINRTLALIKREAEEGR